MDIFLIKVADRYERILTGAARFTLAGMDTLALQINEAIRRWGNSMPRPLPSEDQLAAEWDWVSGLLATNPPVNQARPLTTARDRIGQARRMLIPQAITGF